MNHRQIMEDFKTSKNKFIQAGHDIEDIDYAFAELMQLKKENVISGNEANIDIWAKSGDLGALISFLSKKKHLVDKKRKEKEEYQKFWNAERSKVKVLYEDDNFVAYIPMSELASLKYGTPKWCTARPTNSEFLPYFSKNNVVLVYLHSKHSGEKFAITFVPGQDYMEVFDGNNDYISKSTFEELTGFEAEFFCDEAADLLAEIAQNQKNRGIEAAARGEQVRDANVQRAPVSQKAEREMAKDPMTAARYAVLVLDYLGLPLPTYIASSIKNNAGAYNFYQHYTHKTL